MNGIKKLKNGLDRVVDFIGILFIAITTIIVSATVFTRYFFSYTPKWSEEVSLLLFIWIGFLGIAVGFREKLHIGVGLFVGMMPEKAQTFFDYIAKFLVIAVSIIFIIYGYQFTVLMGGSTMPGTGLPNSVQYIVVPFTGVIMLIYGIELLFKKGMHQVLDENVEE
ncbi:TRAP transporter small permease [Bacillus sp. FJAT-27251]|uniref:TRAP transporter small permease n=1 Tax=Bacillus sp. FJAT-27251 TaxID=1684142 RepID=UPI0006A7D6F9|nr:TRAP transporter small permease [Bacillus sp. FJAT-27251]